MAVTSVHACLQSRRVAVPRREWGIHNCVQEAAVEALLAEEIERLTITPAFAYLAALSVMLLAVTDERDVLLL